MKTLRESQRRFFELITAPDGVASTAARDGGQPLHKLIRGASDEVAAARLQRYANMYFARLHEIFRDDYHAVHALVGDRAFEKLARDYLTQFPSTMPSVRDAAMHMPEFLKGYAPLQEPFPYVHELAQLERTRAEVFDRAEVRPLQAADLESVEPEQWAELSFAPVPAARILELAWPVTTLWRPLVWDEGDVIALEPAATFVLVWRKDERVYHRVVENPAEQTALRLLFGNSSFAEMCEALAAPGEDIGAAAQRAAGLLAGWVREQLIVFA